MEPLDFALKQKIGKGCNQNFHFLENLDDELNTIHLLVGFANAIGGEVIIGVKQNGKVSGVNPNEIFDAIFTILKMNKISKDAFSLDTIILGRHALVRVKIKTTSKKLWLVENGEKVSYLRIGGATVKVNKIIKKVWILIENQVEVAFTDVHKQIVALFTGKSELSLSYIYKDVKFKKSKVDMAVSELLYQKKIQLIVLEGKLMYSIVY